MALDTEQWSLIISVVAVTLSIIVSCALVYMQQVKRDFMHSRVSPSPMLYKYFIDEIVYVALPNVALILHRSQVYESKKEAKIELTKFKETMEKYVKPLLQCSTELSDRLFKICEEDYLESWCASREGEQFERWQREHYFMCSTLFYFGQYFCWLEIIRRKIRFFQANMQDAQDDYRINAALEDVHTQFSQTLPEYLDTKNYDAKIMRRTVSRSKLITKNGGNAVKPNDMHLNSENDVKTLKDNAQVLLNRTFRTDKDFAEFVAANEAEISLFALPREMQKAIGEVLMVERNVEEGDVANLECMEYSRFNSMVEPLFSEYYLSRWLSMDVRISLPTDLPSTVRALQTEGIYRPSDIRFLDQSLEDFAWYRRLQPAEQTRVRIYQKRFQDVQEDTDADWKANSKWLQKLQLDLQKLKQILLGGAADKKVAAKFRLRVLQNKIADLTTLLQKEFQNIRLGDHKQAEKYDYRLRIKRRATLDKIFPTNGDLELLMCATQQQQHTLGDGAAAGILQTPPRLPTSKSFRQRSLSPGRFEMDVGSRRMSAPRHLPPADHEAVDHGAVDPLSANTTSMSAEVGGGDEGGASSSADSAVTKQVVVNSIDSDEECKVEELAEGSVEAKQREKRRRKRRKSSETTSISEASAAKAGGASQRQRSNAGLTPVEAADSATAKADDTMTRPATATDYLYLQQPSPELLAPPGV
jgi:hypothetical protein